MDDAPYSTPLSQSRSFSEPSRKDVKGKGKETRPLADVEGDRLWVDKYEPTSEVH